METNKPSMESIDAYIHIDKPLPLDLLSKIVVYRKTENEQQELLAKQVAKEKTKAKAIKRQQEKLK